MEWNSIRWTTIQIPSRGNGLRAFMCDLRGPDDAHALREQHKHTIIATGGVLFHRLRRSPMVPVHTPGLGGTGYRYLKPPITELWHVPACGFQELLDCLPYFGFPRGAGITDVSQLLTEARSLMLQLHARKPLTLEQIDESYVLAELVNPVHRLDKSEAIQIAEFNKRHFGVREPDHEGRDKIRNWVKKNFFTVGAS